MICDVCCFLRTIDGYVLIFFFSYFRICSDVYKIQEGIGDKVGMLIQSFSTFIASFVIGFTKGWKLTLVILSVSPALGISAALFSKVRLFHGEFKWILGTPYQMCKMVCFTILL